uniref:KIB1-4 beta-propeller domain-containing protein n=2 Tax=Aegilops tauschii TaxID=37682 RepID=A0A453JU07_AEGTS
MADLDLSTPLLSAMDLAEESNVSAAFPLLVLEPPPDLDRSSYKVFTLPDQKLEDVTPFVSSNKAFLATPQGWVLVLGSSDSSSDDTGTYLLNVKDRSRIELPALKDDEVPWTCRCVLSNVVVAPGCRVLVFDHASPVMWFCRVGQDLRCSRHGYDIGCFDLPLPGSPPINIKRHFVDVAPVNGRFFFCESNDSLGTLDFHTNDASEEPEARLGAIAVPFIEVPFGITATYVVESCNDLFLVHIAFHGMCVDQPGELRVYRMDFSEPPAWRKTDCIGNRAFLLSGSNFAASCSASGCGLKPNCVYWVNSLSEKNSDLHVLGLQDGSSEIVKQFENVLGVRKPFWIIPGD